MIQTSSIFAIVGIGVVFGALIIGYSSKFSLLPIQGRVIAKILKHFTLKNIIIGLLATIVVIFFKFILFGGFFAPIYKIQAIYLGVIGLVSRLTLKGIVELILESCSEAAVKLFEEPLFLGSSGSGLTPTSVNYMSSGTSQTTSGGQSGQATGGGQPVGSPWGPNGEVTGDVRPGPNGQNTGAAQPGQQSTGHWLGNNASYQAEWVEPVPNLRTMEVDDPFQQSYVYNRYGSNQPLLGNIGRALQHQARLGADSLDRCMLTRQQQNFILAHLEQNHFATFTRIVDGLGTQRWHSQANNQAFWARFND